MNYKVSIITPSYNSDRFIATSEVDIVLITQKGVFVFESKNYSGWIFGDEKNKNWAVSLPNGEKNQFYNPIMQNKTHLKWMSNFVGEDIPFMEGKEYHEELSEEQMEKLLEDQEAV